MRLVEVLSSDLEKFIDKAEQSGWKVGLSKAVAFASFLPRAD